MGRLNFHGYLISRFFPTRENLMHTKHTKNTCFTVAQSDIPWHTKNQPKKEGIRYDLFQSRVYKNKMQIPRHTLVAVKRTEQLLDTVNKIHHFLCKLCPVSNISSNYVQSASLLHKTTKTTSSMSCHQFAYTCIYF